MHIYWRIYILTKKIIAIIFGSSKIFHFESLQQQKIDAFIELHYRILFACRIMELKALVKAVQEFACSSPAEVKVFLISS